MMRDLISLRHHVPNVRGWPLLLSRVVTWSHKGKSSSTSFVRIIHVEEGSNEDLSSLFGTCGRFLHAEDISLFG